MRYFPIPFSMTTEEKAFGGHASFRQVAYVVMAIILSGFTLFCIPFLPLSVRLLLVLPLVGLGWSMAFLRVHDVDFDRLLILAVKYLLRIKSIRFLPSARLTGTGTKGEGFDRW